MLNSSKINKELSLCSEGGLKEEDKAARLESLCVYEKSFAPIRYFVAINANIFKSVNHRVVLNSFQCIRGISRWSALTHFETYFNIKSEIYLRCLLILTNRVVEISRVVRTKKKMIKKNIDLIVSIYRARLSKVSKFRR